MLHSTPKPAARGGLGRPSLGEPTRIGPRLRDQSPGGVSVGSGDEAQCLSARRRAHGELSAGHERAGNLGSSIGRAHHVRSGTPGAHGRNSRDPRPIGDRTYAFNCARLVTEFLSSRGFGKTISTDKFLRDPSTKEFYDIFKFLIGQLDPLLEIEGTLEIEVPQIMRRLKYPVEVNKSKLAAISGPNTWPQLLAVLEWLIFLIHIHDERIQPLATCQVSLADEQEGEGGDHELLRSVHENYQAYLKGNDGREEEARLRQIYIERADACRDEIMRLKNQHAASLEQLKSFRIEHDRLIELQNAPKQLEAEVERLQGALQSQNHHHERIEAECAELDGEEEGLNQEIEELRVDVQQLNDQVENQAFSKKDIERLKAERGQNRKILEDLRSDGEKIEQSVWELQMRESERAENISRLVRQMNDSVEKLGASMSDAGAMIIRVNLEEPTDALAALDFDEERMRICDYMIKHREIIAEEEATHQEVLNELETSHGGISDIKRECDRLRVRLGQLQKIKEENRIRNATELDDAQRTAEETEDALHQASMGTEGPTIRDAAEVDELLLTLKAFRSQAAQERAQRKEQLRRDVERTYEGRRCVGKELESYVQDLEAIVKSVNEELTAFK